MRISGHRILVWIKQARFTKFGFSEFVNSVLDCFSCTIFKSSHLRIFRISKWRTSNFRIYDFPDSIFTDYETRILEFIKIRITELWCSELCSCESTSFRKARLPFLITLFRGAFQVYMLKLPYRAIFLSYSSKLYFRDNLV